MSSTENRRSNMTCEFCRGRAEELARTRSQVWIGCRDCQRSWKDDSRAHPESPPPPHTTNPHSGTTFIRAAVVAASWVGLAFLIRFALKPPRGDASPFIVFTPAVMAAAFYGGGVAGVLATGFSAALGSLFFLRGVDEPILERWDRIALFMLVGTLITTLSVVIRAARERLAGSLWREQKARADAEAASQVKDEFL